MARPTGSLSLGPVLRISLGMSAGIIGAVAVLIARGALNLGGIEVWFWGVRGYSPFETLGLVMGIGAAWGLLFSPVLWGARVNPWIQGLIVGMIPLLVEGLIVLPLPGSAGMFGIRAGGWFWSWVIGAHVGWGWVGSWWNRLGLQQLHEYRKET